MRTSRRTCALPLLLLPTLEIFGRGLFPEVSTPNLPVNSGYGSADGTPCSGFVPGGRINIGFHRLRSCFRSPDGKRQPSVRHPLLWTYRTVNSVCASHRTLRRTG